MDYYKISYVVPISDTEIRAYTGEIQIKLISRGDCFYDITKIKDITNGTAGQALIKAAGSVYNVSTHSISQNSDLSTVNEKKSSGKFSRELDTIDYIDEQAEREGLSKAVAQPLSTRSLLANALESFQLRWNGFNLYN